MIDQVIPRAVRILLIEDSAADVRLTREALKDAKILNELNVVIDGIAAMKYLKKEDEYKDVLRPDLILLDLNLPKKSGREVLAEVKADEDLKSIPVIVLTTSDAETDIERAYKLGANSYLVKPVGIEAFTKVVQSLKDYWVVIVKLPANPDVITS